MVALSKKAESESADIGFDYQLLSPQQRLLVQERTGEIKERLRHAAQDIWEIGQKLSDVRSQLQHGLFLAWLTVEFGWSRRTAYNFISVYETFPEIANFAKLDIATSALYKLASPSTPQPVRDEFVERAKKGEKITHQIVSQTLKQDKQLTTSPSVISNPIVPSKLEIRALIPKDRANASPQEVPGQTSPPPSDALNRQIPVEIQPGGWYLLENKHILFCGDTAAPGFCDRTSEAELALAITSNDWDHDWLIDHVNNLILLKESSLKAGLIEQTLSLYSEPGDTVIFPWLPDEEMLAIAHRQGKRFVAGDVDLDRCRRAIAQSGLSVTSIDL